MDIHTAGSNTMLHAMKSKHEFTKTKHFDYTTHNEHPMQGCVQQLSLIKNNLAIRTKHKVKI